MTKVAQSDRARLLGDVKGDKIEVFCKDSKTTSVFENTYRPDNLDTRFQEIKAIGAPERIGVVF